MKKRLTRKDIALAAGVSPSTVSRALAGSELLPEATIQRIREIAAELGYQPNTLGRRLAVNRSFQLGFAAPAGLAPDKGAFRVSYYSMILDAIVFAASGRGYHVTIHPYQPEGANPLEGFTNLIASRQADGLIVGGLKQRSRIPPELFKRNIPFVVIGAKPANQRIPCVNFDPEPGIREMFAALEKRNYRRIFFVSGNPKYHDAIIQRQALEKIAEASRIEPGKFFPGDYTRTCGYQVAEQLSGQLKKGDCVFLANDRMAAGFFRYCMENKISIPGQVGIVGCDDDDIGAGLYPGLSTIAQPRREMGETAVELLLAGIENLPAEKLHVTLPEKFILRESI